MLPSPSGTGGNFMSASVSMSKMTLGEAPSSPAIATMRSSAADSVWGRARSMAAKNMR